MRILVLSQHFWPESFRINDVVRQLASAGHHVEVMTGQPNYPGGTIFDGFSASSSGTTDWQGVALHRVPLVPRGRASALRLVANYLSFIASAATIGAWRLRGRGFDVILVYATSPLLQAIAAVVLARLKRAALVTWVQDLWPESLQVTGYVRSPRLLGLVAIVVRWIYARNTMLLVPSPAFEPSVRELAPPGLPIAWHPNPGDAADAGPVASEDPALTLDDTLFNVVFAGNLGIAQALDSVLDAAERLRDDTPELRLVLVGSGQRSTWLAEQVDARRLPNVQLAGRFAPEQMAGIYAQAQALLVSLKADPAMALTVPSKVQSYLAAGRPIVAALDGEGARLVVEAGAGLACRAGDGAALADTLRRMHALPESARAAMGVAGRIRYLRDYAPERLTPQLIGHLEEAVRRQGGPAVATAAGAAQRGERRQ